MLNDQWLKETCDELLVIYMSNTKLHWMALVKTRNAVPKSKPTSKEFNPLKQELRENHLHWSL